MSDLHVTYVGKVVGVNRRLAWSRRLGKAYPEKAYAEFKKALTWEIKKAMGVCPPWPYPISGPVEIKIDAVLPPQMDLDNIVKPILDAFQIAGAVANDWGFTKLVVNRIDTAKRGQDSSLELWVSPTGGDNGNEGLGSTDETGKGMRRDTRS